MSKIFELKSEDGNNYGLLVFDENCRIPTEEEFYEILEGVQKYLDWNVDDLVCALNNRSCACEVIHPDGEFWI